MWKTWYVTEKDVMGANRRSKVILTEAPSNPGGGESGEESGTERECLVCVKDRRGLSVRTRGGVMGISKGG